MWLSWFCMGFRWNACSSLCNLVTIWMLHIVCFLFFFSFVSEKEILRGRQQQIFIYLCTWVFYYISTSNACRFVCLFVCLLGLLTYLLNASVYVFLLISSRGWSSNWCLFFFQKLFEVAYLWSPVCFASDLCHIHFWSQAPQKISPHSYVYWRLGIHFYI